MQVTGRGGNGLADEIWLERIATVRDELAPGAYCGRAARILDPVAEASRAFFEGYMSCDLEGISVHWEAMRRLMQIADLANPNPSSGLEALDILHLVAAARREARREACWSSYEEFVSQLRDWHRQVFRHRPGHMPGEFKTRGNCVADITFVAPAQVEATLREGYDLALSVPRGFPQAVMFHQLVASVHPFVDGNGRMARLTMNTVLTAAGEWRIIIPRACRYNYRIALRNICEFGDAAEFIRRIHFYQRWTASIRWGDLDSTYQQFVRTGALQDPLRLYINFRKAQGDWDKDWPPAGLEPSQATEALPPRNTDAAGDTLGSDGMASPAEE